MEFPKHSTSAVPRRWENSRQVWCAWFRFPLSALPIAVLALGYGAITWGGEGYRPLSSSRPQTRPYYQSDNDFDREPSRSSVEPTSNRYAPYPAQRRRPAPQPAFDPSEHLERGNVNEPVEDDEAESEESSAQSREPQWHGIPPRNRRITKPLSKPHGTPQTEEGVEANASLVADDGGPIADLLLHYGVNSEGELGAIYNDLFQHLGSNVRLQVCCSNEASVEAFMNRWGTAAMGQGRQVQVVNVNRPITVWARDRRISRQTPDGRPAASFVPTAHFTYDPEKQNDLVLSSLLYPTGLAPTVALSSFHLEGGNVVSNRRHVFVGANAYDDNAHRFASEAAMFSELSKIFGRQAIPIQGSDGQVPWIHSDMYLTPIDSRTILVSNPEAGCRLLDGRNTILVPHRDRQVQAEFDVLSPDSPRQVRFDTVANQLSDMGYQVIRLPSLMNVEKDWMVTYNNVLMDYQGGQRVVYMPIYHIPELDHAAAQVYRALGFEVRPIDVSTIFQLGGAIRCLANVTRRLPFEARMQNHAPDVPGRLQVFSVDPSAVRVREPRPRFERRPLPPSLRERPQASIQRPADVGH